MNMSHPLRILLSSLMISLLILTSSPLMFAAQLSDDTAFVGTITDLVTGEPLSGVHVSVGDTTAETDAAGNYVLTLPTGNYDIYAQLPGYIGMTQLYRQLDMGRARVDFEMVIANPTEEQAAIIDEKLVTDIGIQSVEELEQELEELSNTTQAVYESPETIRVLMPDGSVQVMLMEEYLRGVVWAEMSPYWPMEALKAQAVAARCYAATAHRHDEVGADVCTTTHCQVWKATTYDSSDRAVAETAGVVARYNGEVIYAFFHGHCNGHTQNVEDVWSSYVPYLRSVECICGYDYYYGHGVGLCQVGARAYALQGWTFDQILKHYYTGVEIYVPVPSDVPSASVTPSSGDKGTVFTFQATYNQVLTGAPAVAIVLFQQGGELRAEAMQRVGDGTEPYTYVLQTNLSAGTQAYQFYFDDGDGNVARWPRDGSFQTVAVSNTGTPSIDTGVLVEDIIHSNNFLSLYGWGEHVTSYTAGDTDGGVILSGSTSGAFTSAISEISGGFQTVYVNWYGIVPTGATLTLSVSTRAANGTWRDWVQMGQADDAPDGRSVWSEPIFGESTAVQYRVQFTANSSGESPIFEYVRLLCLNGSDGPTAASLVGQGDLTEYQLVPVLSRESWGADASLVSISDSADPQAFVLHDTASLNGLDPTAALRCIEYMQSISLNMGGLACNYAVDALGNVYEARDGGASVAGTHLDEANDSAIGVLLLGDYASSAPSSAMVDSLEDLIAQDSVEYELNPTGYFSYGGSSYPVVSAHSGWENVSCPGAQILSIMSTIRSTALSRFSLIPPRITVEGLTNGAYVASVQRVTVSANVPINSAVLRVDGVQVDATTISPYILRWNTAGYVDGKHTVVISATNDGGSAQQSLTLYVDNTAPTGTVTAPAWTNSIYTYFAVDSSGANYVQFSNDWLWEGEELSHQPNTGSVATDTLAINDSTWLAADASYGYWYGPYTFGLPAYRTYDAYFRLRGLPDEDVNLAQIDVSDSNGLRIYASRDIASADFASEDYEDVLVVFDYLSSSVPDAGMTVGGLEFRVLYYALGTLAMDRVTVYGEKLPVSSSVGWALEAVEGEQTVLVRLSDKAGNAVESTLTVGLDLTEPTWVSKGTTSAIVRDTVSGLDPSTAMWCTSSNGGKTWSSWNALSLDVDEGTTATVTLQAPTGTSGMVRFRIADLAGNMADTVYVTYLPLSYHQ